MRKDTQWNMRNFLEIHRLATRVDKSAKLTQSGEAKVKRIVPLLLAPAFVAGSVAVSFLAAAATTIRNEIKFNSIEKAEEAALVEVEILHNLIEITNAKRTRNSATKPH